MCVLSTLCGNVDKHRPFDIYIYINICVYIYIHNTHKMRVPIHIHMHTCLHVLTYTHAYLLANTHTPMHMHITYTCKSIYTRACMHISTYTYIHIHVQPRAYSYMTICANSYPINTNRFWLVSCTKEVHITSWYPEGCSTNAFRALQNSLAKIYNARNHIYDEYFKLKLCTCAQSHALSTRTKLQLEVLPLCNTQISRGYLGETLTLVKHPPAACIIWIQDKWFLKRRKC